MSCNGMDSGQNAAANLRLRRVISPFRKIRTHVAPPQSRMPPP